MFNNLFIKKGRVLNAYIVTPQIKTTGDSF